jgi:hypothetical protein
VSSATIAQDPENPGITLNLAAVKPGTISINTAATVASLPAGCPAGGATAVVRKSPAGSPAGVEGNHCPDALASDLAEAPEQVIACLKSTTELMTALKARLVAAKHRCNGLLKPGCGHAVIKFTPRVDELLKGPADQIITRYEFFLPTPLLFVRLFD